MSNTTRQHRALVGKPHEPGRRMKGRLPAGFTLIELMIVVAIVGILAAIAYPSYTEYVRRAARADAQGALTGLAAVMEQWFSDHNTYEGFPPDGGTLYPMWSPVDEPETKLYYRLRIEEANGTYDRLRATPRAETVVAGTGILELDSAGRRGWARNHDGEVKYEEGEDTWER